MLNLLNLHLQYIYINMKKLIYSALSFAILASTLFVGCGKDETVDPDPVALGPNITFQTNSGSGAGVYTFADGSVLTGESIKIGMRLTSDVNLKTSKIAVNFNGVGDVVLHDSTYTSNTKTSSKDVTYKFPTQKGAYVFTIYATDKDNNSKTAKITIIAKGPLTDRGIGTFYSLKAVDNFSAFDLMLGEAVTASGTANLLSRDIVDGSTGATLSKTWNTQNGTMFLKSDATGKIGGKIYGQFASEQDIIDAWNAAAAASKTSSVSNVDVGDLIIAKVVRSGQTYYFVIGINDVQDGTGSENDYYEFQYKQ
jgi:hypothetical protein